MSENSIVPTPEASSSDWPAWAASTRPANRKRGNFEHSWQIFSKGLQKIASWLLSGEPPRGQSAPNIAALRNELMACAPNSKVAAKFSEWIDRLVAAGNASGLWDIPLPPPKVRIAPPRATVVRSDMALLASIVTLEKAFIRRLLYDHLTPGQTADAALLAAILWGGICRAVVAKAFCAAEPNDFLAHEGRLRVLLKIGKDMKEQAWWPDPLTSSLLVRGGLDELVARAKSANHIDRDISGRVRAAISSLSLPSWPHAPRSLFRAAQVLYLTRVPGYLVSYAAGQTQSTSLAVCEWQRINHWHQNEEELPPQKEETNEPTFSPLHHPKFGVFGTRSARPREQVKLIRDFYALLRTPRDAAEKLRHFISREAPYCWPVTLLCFQWILSRLKASDEHGLLKADSARRYLNSILRPLISVADQEDLLDFYSEDFEYLYEAAGDRAKNLKEKSFFWGRLREFHSFLTSSYGVPDVDFQDLDGFVGSDTAKVSANFVSESEFGKFREGLLLAGATGDVNPATQVLLAGILGFRCGLRRREAQLLHLRDLHPGPFPMLIIRASRFGALKSASSERRIPLRGLIPDAELAILMRYRDNRSVQLSGGLGLLFANAHTPWTPLPAEHLFDPVTQLFQAITGSRGITFRFHHLRHSFANWTLLALLAADNPRLLACAPPFLADSLSQSRIRGIQETLFPVMNSAERAVERRNLYQLSYLLGHLSPATTLKHYVHVLDWLCGREMELSIERLLSGFSAPQLGKLCGLSNSMPYAPSYQRLTHQPAAFLRQFVKSRLPASIPQCTAEPAAELDLSSLLENIQEPRFPHPETLVSLLARRALFPRSVRLHEAYGISADAMARAESDYLRLYAKQSAKALSDAPQPIPPRNLADRKTYWHILRMTYETFCKGGLHRTQLRETAKALIRRVGPAAGNLYVRDGTDKVTRLRKGLISMGVRDEDITVQSRSAREDRRIKRGVDCYTITVAQCSEGRRKTPGYEGIIRGLNHAAIWIEFAANEERAQRRPVSVTTNLHNNR